MARRRLRLTSIGPPPESLFGRDESSKAVETLVREGARVVTLTGPGGIGKSRVAREVGRRLGADGPADVVLCELGDVRDEATLVKALARAASVAAPTSRGPKAIETIAQRLAASRSDVPLLVLLDDADGVVGPAATVVRACLDASADLRFLVTSREALGIAGEHRYEIGPLDAPSARALFEAGAEGGSWSPDELTSLIEQLDGLPLAIELAARRSRLVPPGDLLAKIEDRFRLLKTDRRDVARLRGGRCVRRGVHRGGVRGGGRSRARRRSARRRGGAAQEIALRRRRDGRRRAADDAAIVAGVCAPAARRCPGERAAGARAPPRDVPCGTRRGGRRGAVRRVRGARARRDRG